MALFPRRYLRFMAKSELFWFPLGPFIASCGAFPVRRGERDLEAVETAVRLCREGHIVVMFPEGTRREKGLRKRHEARWRSGAARIALEAGVPLVPAGIAGTADLSHLAKLRVVFGDPIALDDLGGDVRRRRRPARHGPAQREDRRARGIAAMKPLLAVDGDSFAHRAFHALPKSFRRDDGGPANTLIGFMSMLLRLWQAERPRAVVVGWDTLFVPTYRNELLETYQSGREFDPEIVDQLALLPALVSATGIVCGKKEGFEADDFLAAAVAGERARGGTTLVATSDRDAFQLAAPDVTILQPVRGVSELARIGPAEVRERYGVDPQQVCDFIALRGDPSDKIPGARGIGEKTAATLLQTYPDLEAMIAAGRFEAEAEKLRTYRHIATLDPTAPLPDIPDLEPDWAAGARAAEELGVERLASRLREV